MRRPSRRLFGLALCVATVILGLPTVDAQALAPRVVVTHPAPVPAGDPVVATAITTSFDVVLALPRQAAWNDFLAGITNQASPDYRHFLTPRQFARDFGAPASAVAAVRRYLADYGLDATSLSAGHLVLHVRGSTSDIARAF